MVVTATAPLTMFNVDKGVVVPFAVEDNFERPYDLTAATCLLAFTDGATFPLTITDARAGYCEFQYGGTLSPGIRYGNVRITYDATHEYNSETVVIHFRAPGT